MGRAEAFIALRQALSVVSELELLEEPGELLKAYADDLARLLQMFEDPAVCTRCFLHEGKCGCVSAGVSACVRMHVWKAGPRLSLGRLAAVHSLRVMPPKVTGAELIKRWHAFYEKHQVPVMFSGPNSYAASPVELFFAAFKRDDVNPNLLPVGKT